MFERILVAVDDDAILARVLDTAADLAAALPARLALTHAVDAAGAAAMAAPTGVPLATGTGTFAVPEILEAREAAGQAFLKRAATGLPNGTAVELVLRPGPPVVAIIGAAREWGADLVVIGTHGRGGIARLALGSVAEGVVRAAPCPVLVIRADAEGA